MKGPAEESKSGRWKLGQQYSPKSGRHEGHVVEVVNPEVVLVKHGIVREGAKIRKVSAKMPCVLVRCVNCLESFSFPEEMKVP